MTSGGNNFSCNGGDIYLVELDITPSSNTYAFRITNESGSIQSDIMSGTLDGTSGSSIASIGFGNGVIGSMQNLIFDDIVVTQNPSNPLPVELVDFQARFDRGSVWLSWRTASEHDNDRFEVEHSVDAKHWATLGAVPGAGYSLQERTYGFRHDQPAAGTNYYRLRQVDFDGSSEYSPVVSLEVPRTEDGLVAFPNPIGELLWVVPPREEESTYTATVVDWSGRFMGTWIFSSKTSIDAGGWPAGVYVVHLRDATGRIVATQRLIK